MSVSLPESIHTDSNHNTSNDEIAKMDEMSKMCGELTIGSGKIQNAAHKGSTDMSTAMKDVATVELGETDQKREDCLNQLRKWVIEQSYLKGCCNEGSAMRLDDPNVIQGTKFLLRFLRSNNFDVDKAAKQMEAYLRMKWEFPQWHTGLEPKEGERFLELLENGYIFVSPGRDKEGRKVLVNIAREVDPSRHSSSDIMKAVMSTLETLLIMDEETQIRGLSYVFYFKGMKFSQVFIWSPTEAAKMLTSNDANLPIRHRAVAISDTPFGMGIVIDFGKSFLRPELRTIMQVVPDAARLKKASDNLFNDPEVLPSDIIGDEGKYTAREMGALWKQTVMEHRDHLKSLDELVIEKESTFTTNNTLKEENIEGAASTKKSWFGW